MSADVLAGILAELTLLDTAEKMQLLDVLMGEIYGCTLGENDQRLFDAGHRWKPRKLPSPEANFMVHMIEEQRADGVSFATAMADFLKTMAVGKFAAALPRDMSDQEVALAVKKFLADRVRDRKKLEAEQKTTERRYYEAKALKNL